MPKLELKPLTAEALVLAQRIHELLKDGKPGQMIPIPPDLLRDIDDAVMAATVARRRLEWLHSQDSTNVEGYEWGVFRVKWEGGRAVEVWQTNSDFSDLDGAAGLAVKLEPGAT